MIGYVPQALSAASALTGYENLLVFAQLYDLPRREQDQRIRETLTLMGIAQAWELALSKSGRLEEDGPQAGDFFHEASTKSSHRQCSLIQGKPQRTGRGKVHAVTLRVMAPYPLLALFLNVVHITASLLLTMVGRVRSCVQSAGDSAWHGSRQDQRGGPGSFCREYPSR